MKPQYFRINKNSNGHPYTLVPETDAEKLVRYLSRHGKRVIRDFSPDGSLIVMPGMDAPDAQRAITEWKSLPVEHK